MRNVVIFLSLLFHFHPLLATQHQSPLLVWLDFENVEAQRAARLRYKNILEKTFNRPIVYTNNETGQVDIRLMDRYTGQVNKSWFVSNYLIDVIPAFSLIKLKEYDIPDTPLVGAIRRPYFISFPGTRYPLDDMNLAITMLKNRRLDVVLDYDRESGYYTQIEKNFEVVDFAESKSIRVLFRDLSNTKRFNQAMSEVAGIKENVDTIINDIIPVPNQRQKNENEFTWLMIAKHFDQQSNELVVTDTDFKISLWLEGHLSDMKIQSEQSNITNAYERIGKDENACVFNTAKSKGREALAHYSLPTYLFLDYRLYMLNSINQTQTIESLIKGKGTSSVDFESLFKASDSTMFGYYEYLNRAANFEKAMGNAFNQNPERFIQIKTMNRELNLTLLQRRRIDYLIAFPFVMQQNLALHSSEVDLISYPLKYFDTPFVSYLACAKSAAGKSLVEKVNTILRRKEKQKELRKIIAEEMLPADKPSFERAFDEMYSASIDEAEYQD